MAQRVSWSKVWDACLHGPRDWLHERYTGISKGQMQHCESLKLAQACSMEDVLSSVAALQLMKFIRFKSLFQNTFR